MTDRDKLWAFLALLAAIIVLSIVPVVISHYVPPLPAEAYKLADSALTILGTAFGAASLALFRTSQATNDMASALKAQAETAQAASPSAPQPVVVTNSDTQPVPTKDS